VRPRAICHIKRTDPRNAGKWKKCGRYKKFLWEETVQCFELRRIVIVITIAAAISCPAMAQDYPTGTIRIINPFAAGGTAAVQAQALSNYLSPILGQPVIVENKSGAGTTIAGTFVARAAPNGYTLLIAGPPTYSINPALIPKVSYDGYKAFTQIAVVSRSTNGIAVNAKSGITSIDDLVAKAKANPNSITFGTPGVGSVSHLAMIRFMEVAGIKMTHVPYSGAPPVVTDLLGKHIDLGVINLGPLVPGKESGDLRILATTSIGRSSQTPDVPTLDELGYPGFVIEAWNSISGPAGIPEAIVAKLSDLIGEALTDPRVIKAFMGAGLEIKYMSHAEAEAFVKKDSESYVQLIKTSGIKK
jgi:tripartite-type tricarboxylate transporter receptor subunit TctC